MAAGKSTQLVAYSMNGIIWHGENTFGMTKHAILKEKVQLVRSKILPISKDCSWLVVTTWLSTQINIYRMHFVIRHCIKTTGMAK
jgi:hypothetical protein